MLKKLLPSQNKVLIGFIGYSKMFFFVLFSFYSFKSVSISLLKYKIIFFSGISSKHAVGESVILLSHYRQSHGKSPYPGIAV